MLQTTKEQRERYRAIRNHDTPLEVNIVLVEAMIECMIDSGVCSFTQILDKAEHRIAYRRARKFDVKS